MTITITRTDISAEELRRAARRAHDANQARRLLALALILEGASRSEAARLAGMDRQSLRDWVHRYNAEGIAGLCDRPRTGRKPLLNEDQLAGLGKMVEAQPDPRQDGVVRWRCIDLKAKIAADFGVEISERSVARLLKDRGFSKLSARPRHPEADEASQQTSRPIFPGSYATACLSMPRQNRSKSGFRTRPV